MKNIPHFTVIPGAFVCLLLAGGAASQDGTSLLDWGRSRAYFSGGVMISHDREEFSKADVFAGFNLDKSWLPFRVKKTDGQPQARRCYFNSFFEARLTSIPVQTEEVPGTARPATGSTPNVAENLLASRKAAQLRIGLYMPWITTRWEIGPPDKKAQHGFFLAPLATAGLQSITGSRQVAATEAGTRATQLIGNDDLYNFLSFGLRIGHFQIPEDPNRAPELITYIDLTRGRFENFREFDAAARKVVRPWRWYFEGRLRVPGARFLFVGFEVNAGPGRDDIRFLFGTSFDIAKVLEKLLQP